MSHEQTAQIEQTETETTGDDFVAQCIDRSVRLAIRAERGRTRSNLGIAGEMARAIEHTMITVCKSQEDIADWRESTIGQFTRPLSKSTGLTLTTSKLCEFLKIHNLVDSLPADVATLAQRVNWESLRVLARWITHEPGNVEFVAGEGYMEAWKVATGCEEKLIEIIKGLTTRPKDRASLVRILDDHERALRGETDKPASDLGRFSAVAEFLTSIEKRAEKLKLSKAELSDWLIRSGLVTVQTGTLDPATMTAEQGASLAAGIMAANNGPTAKAIVSRLSSFLLNEEANVKPFTAATAPLNDSGKPNHDPLANAQTRIVMQGDKRA